MVVNVQLVSRATPTRSDAPSSAALSLLFGQCLAIPPQPVSARSEEVSTEIDTNCGDCTLLAAGAPAGAGRTCMSPPN